MIILENLSLPCPVNRLWRQGRGGTYLSKEGNDKSKRMVAEIHAILGGPPEPMQGAVGVTIQWWPKYAKKYVDVDAYIKSTLDALQNAAVYVDDKQVECVSCERMTTVGNKMSITITEIQ